MENSHAQHHAPRGHSERRHLPRLLFVAHRVPYPPDKGEKLRAFHQLCALAERYRVTLASLAHSADEFRAAEQLTRWCDTVLVARARPAAAWTCALGGLLTGQSITQGYFHSPRLHQLVRRHTRRHHVALAFGSSSSTLPYLLRAAVPHRVMDLVDVDSAKWRLYADNTHGPKRRLYAREARTVAQLEERAVLDCDAVLLVSAAETQALGYFPAKVHAIGNGVDLDYFQPVPPSAATEPTLVFTGTMNYRPNVEGVVWFVDQVWPELKRDLPDLRFDIVGRDPTPAVRALESRPGVRVTGGVPDVRPYVAAAHIAVCPLLIARGIQNKVLEAMAMARPVVGSGPALEGLDIEPGIHALQADTPQQWRDQLRLLWDNPQRRHQVAQVARARIETHYTWQHRADELLELCGRFTPAALPADLTPPPPAQAQPERPPTRAAAIPSPSRPAVRAAQPLAVSGFDKWYAKALWFLTFAYGALVAYVSLVPSGVGGWIDDVPNDVQNALHGPAYAGLMLLASLALVISFRPGWGAFGWIGLFCCVFGFAMEYLQGRVGGRTVSFHDAMRNVVGVVGALAFVMLCRVAALAWRRHRNHRKPSAKDSTR